MRCVKIALAIFVAVLIFKNDESNKIIKPQKLPAEQNTFEKKRFLIKFLPGTPLAERKAFFVRAKLKPVEFGVFGYDIGEGSGNEKIQALFIENYEVESPEKSSPFKGGCLAELRRELGFTENRAAPVIQWYENMLGVKKAHKFLADRKVRLKPEGIVIADSAMILTHPDIAPALKKDKDGRAIVWVRRENRHLATDHGTFVACLAAGYHDSKGVDVAGPSAYILPLALNFGDNNDLFSSDIAVGLKYYAELEKKGEISFHVVNMSLGFYSDLGVFKAAVAGLPDKLFVVAASNEYGRNIDKKPIYPASWQLPNILVVAATDKDDILAAFSNIGRKRIEIAAPGVGIQSCAKEDEYEVWNGTSASTPLVAGTAALFYAMGLNLTVSEVKDYLFRGADRLKVLQGDVKGARRLNVWKSVELLWNSRRREIQTNNLP